MNHTRAVVYFVLGAAAAACSSSAGSLAGQAGPGSLHPVATADGGVADAAASPDAPSAPESGPSPEAATADVAAAGDAAEAGSSADAAGPQADAAPAPPAPTTSCTPALYDATAMTHSVGAAAPGGWNLWGDGYVALSAPFDAGPVIITVAAYGSSAGGVWPHMVVSIDGLPIGDTFVSATSWSDYGFPFTATAGTHEVRVAFDNDAIVGTEDRNLFVASIAVGCLGGTPTPSPSPTPSPTPTPSPSPSPTPTPTPTPTGTIRIMPLGDSITLGVNGGYRDGLYTRLTSAGKSFDFVGSQSDPYTVVADHDHEGHPGFTIGDIASNVDAWLATYKPDYVLLMIGTNDVAWWCAQTAAEVADSDAALIDQILADLPNVWVVVSSIPPESSSIIQPNDVDRATLAAQYDAEIATRVQARITAGKRVRWADGSSVLTLADLYDGIHPTEAAADKVAQVWFDALSPILP